MCGLFHSKHCTDIKIANRSHFGVFAIAGRKQYLCTNLHCRIFHNPEITKVVRRLFLFSVLACLLALYSPSATGQAIDKMSVVWAKTKLPKGSTFGVRFDYGHSLFHGFPFEDLCRHDAEFAEGMKEAEERFYEELKDDLWFNYATKKRVLRATKEDNPDYTIIVRPREVDEYGNFLGEVVILDADGRPFANMRNVFGDGGRIGSYTNLIGDGYQSVVKVIISELALAIDEGKA